MRDRVTEPQRLVLAHVHDLDEPGGALDLVQQDVLAAVGQRVLEDLVLGEVRHHADLALGGDDRESAGAGLGGLLGDELDARGVHDR